MQEDQFSNHSCLLSISIRLGISLALGILTVLLPLPLVSSASPFLDPVDQPQSSSDAPEFGWSALPNRGLNHRVRAMVLAGDSLYVAGRFTKTNDGSLTSLGRVARIDLADGAWQALPNQGLSNEAVALALLDGDLYVGGWFTQTVDTALTDLGNIARYDPTADTWQALPNQGLDGLIFGLGVVGSDLYAGGLFAQSGDGAVTDLNGVARYDSLSGTWQALPNQGLIGNVYALAAGGSAIYAGGSFSRTGDGSLTNLGNIAHYDAVAGTWQALPNQGLNGTVNGLWVSGSDVYVGGDFTQTNDGAVTNLNGVARYDSLSGTWRALPNQGLNHNAYAFAVLGNDIYVGGTFDQTADGSLTNLNHIARYDPAANTWHAVPNQGLNSWVYALVPVDDDLYVGGEFNQVVEGKVSSLNRIARFGEIDKVYLPLIVRS